MLIKVLSSIVGKSCDLLTTTTTKTMMMMSGGVLITAARGIKSVRQGDYFRGVGYAYGKIYKGGLLPRPDPKLETSPLPLPNYKDKHAWSTRKATFGQNDYIDILGNGRVHPVDLIRGPPWLIGFRGNELQRLSRQIKFQGGELKSKNPLHFYNINKRIKYLMWRYNHKFGGIKK